MTSANCGLVHIRGHQLPPPPKKWGEVSFLPGQIRIRSSAAQALPPSRRVSKWCDLEKADLSRLEACQVPELWRGRAVGLVVSGAIPLVSAATNYNRFVALACRVYRSPPKPRRAIWAWASQFSSSIFPIIHCPPARMSDDEWVASFPQPRRKALEQAMELYKRSGWCKKFATFHSFLKDEFLPFFDKDGNGLVPLRHLVSRLINAPHDVTHCIAGPRIKPYMQWLKVQWHPENTIFYGGTEPEKLQHWLDVLVARGPGLYFWSDYSMFDSSHNEQTWKFVEGFYQQHFEDPDFMRVLEAWRSPQGTLGDLKFQGRVFNASGRDDTAFANAVLNGVAMLLSVTAAWLNKPLADLELSDIHLISSELLLSVCGDDALGRLPSCTDAQANEFRLRMIDNLTAFGFAAKFYCSFRLEDAVYLGHRPLPVGQRWYWSRTLGRCLYKLGWQCKVRGDPGAHFRGICRMHQVCSSHVPILAEIANEYLQLRPKAKINHWRPDVNKPWEEMGKFGPSTYDRSTVEALARAYTFTTNINRGDIGQRDVYVTARDVDDCLQHVVERVRASGGGPCVVDHWLLRHMVWMDEQ